MLFCAVCMVFALVFLFAPCGGRTSLGQIPKERKDKPADLRQSDRGVRWMVKPKEDGTSQIDVAILVFSDERYISIDINIILT